MSSTTLSIQDRIVNLVAEQAGCSKEDIKLEAKLYDDLGFDSLDSVELVMAVEDEFHMEISDENAEKLQTVQQIIDYVQANAKLN